MQTIPIAAIKYSSRNMETELKATAGAYKTTAMYISYSLEKLFSGLDRLFSNNAFFSRGLNKFQVNEINYLVY